MSQAETFVNGALPAIPAAPPCSVVPFGNTIVSTSSPVAGSRFSPVLSGANPFSVQAVVGEARTKSRTQPLDESSPQSLPSPAWSTAR